MEKILDALYNMAMNGDQAADELYWEIKDIDTASFPRWVLDNDERLRAVLPLKSIMDDPSDAEKALLSEYIGARNAGVKQYTGDKKTDVYGRPLRGVDDFMQAFGVKPSDDVELSDNDRSAFTNPENPKYWGNRSSEDKVMAAYNMGYGTVDEMENDLRRAGNDYQRANQVEGYGPNNEKQVGSWLWSAAKGLAAPRVKEAQVSGREPTIQDYAGDAVESGISLVPGFGLFSKGGRVMRGAGMVLDNAGVPLVTNLVDSKLLYNPNTLGTKSSGLNPRSEFDLGRVGEQTAGIVGSKGALKGTAMMGKNAFEKYYGNRAGGEAFKSGLSFIENIGENTNNLIARRQAALDRKAELAKQMKNVSLPADRDIPTGGGNTADLGAAENFRILSNEAERIANSEKARVAYRDAIAKDRSFERFDEMEWDAYEPLRKIGGEIIPSEFPVNPATTIAVMLDDGKQLILPKGTSRELLDGALTDYRRRMSLLEQFKANPEWKNAQAAIKGDFDPKAISEEYRIANEATPYEGELVLLPDGNIANEKWVNTNNGITAVRYPGADYDVVFSEKTTPLRFQYETAANPDMDINKLHPREPVDGELSRNVVVRDKILKDDILNRKLNSVNILGKHIRLDKLERPRDIGASWFFNAAPREGFLGRNNTASIDEKRERAIWNKMLNALSPLTTNPKLPVEVRKKNADAIMNVMQYGLDGLPVEIYMQSPETYHRIAKELKIDDWKHYTETNPQPTPSSSRTK